MSLLDWTSIFGQGSQTQEDGPESAKEQESVSSESVAGSQESEASKYLTVGFDWGTSCSKIVIRDPYGLESPAYLVNFGDYASDTSPYFLPSSFSIDRDGRLRLAKDDGPDTISELKVHLMQHPEKKMTAVEGARPKELAALYIAKTLRYARRWFWREYGDRYEQNQPFWEFNLGIPAASHDDEEISSLFRRIARVGWGLSQRENPTISQARDDFQKLRRGELDPGIHEDFVGVVPEVAAQVVGYARSSLRKTGLHALVDVGASTLDIAGFILTEDQGEDRYSILEAGVYPLGAFQLERQRLPEIKKLGRKVLDSESSEEWVEEMDLRCQDPMREVPTLRGYFPEPVREEICWSDIKHIDKDVMSDCFRAVRKLLADLRGKGAPNNPMWDEGLPIFVAGGGRNLKVYWKALRKVDHWRGDHLRVAPFQMRELPSLEDLRAPNLSDEIGPRFAVAYGLSYPADDIGEIRPPHEIPDLDLDKKNTSFDTTDYKDTKAFT